MLTLTEAAADVIQRLTSRPGMPDTSGLRISPKNGGTALTVALADGPSPQDEVVEADRARVYLGRGAAERLDGKILDARVDERGSVSFQIRRKSAAAG
jgi:Fe-S cluster assembly iron-binding protein IscA